MKDLVHVDRIDRLGNITEHITRDGKRTLCGIAIEMSQPPSQNRSCARCACVARRFRGPEEKTTG